MAKAEKCVCEKCDNHKTRIQFNTALRSWLNSSLKDKLSHTDKMPELPFKVKSQEQF